MKAVLGIDAAWTEKEPSGVALVVDDGSGWRLIRVAASYDAFLAGPEPRPIERHRGSVPDAEALLEAAEMFAGHPVNLVAVDMPLSMDPVTSRRVSDNLVSAAYGAKHASTHTPSATRPGRISDDFRTSFERAGYPLATKAIHGQALIEVYPHPALIELAAAERRLPYKASKIAKYWPGEVPVTRRERLIDTWRQIVVMLDARIAGVSDMLAIPPISSKGFELKAFEDTLDAVVCAWVGACAMEGAVTPFGDETSAIWIPRRT